MLNAIKGIYNTVLASVRSNNHEYTDYIECPFGVKQGCSCSSTLFCIFVTELTRQINLQGRHGIQLMSGLREIHHLLFADDTILVSDSIFGLQSKLNILHQQCIRLGLNINIEKTKIIVFRKGGHLSKFENWNFGGLPIQVVNAYKYLGIEVTTRLSFTNSVSLLVAKAKQTCYELQKTLNTINCHDINIFTKLFDSKVQPILSYSCEVWGMCDLPNIEQVHTIALKRFLNVSIHASNTIVYGDTGRFPLYINHWIKCIKYWFRLLHMPRERFPRQAYEMLEKLDENGVQTWATNVRNILCKNGFGHVWIFKNVGDINQFCTAFKERLIDNFKQNWHCKLNSHEHLECYRSFKSMIEKEQFLHDNTFNRYTRNILLRFRFGVSDILCHRFRFCNDSTNKLTCPICRTDNENEYHVMFVCSLYENLRTEMLPTKFILRRNIMKMYILLADSKYQFVLASYLCNMFKIRAHVLSERRNLR